MSISKAIKPWTPEPEPTTRLGKLWKEVKWVFMMNLYYPVDSFFSRYYERISRSLAFAIRGWMHYDFESAYLYDIMAFKLKRIYKVLENGHAVQEDDDMKALQEAIAICEKLFNFDYAEKYYDEHEKVWGQLEIGKNREFAEGEYEKYRQSIWDVSINEEKDRNADLDRLNEILKKHEPTWWD
jgi:hypothetical protein